MRFQFGKNWKTFLETINEERITEAENSLKKYLNKDTLNGLSFLDIGSGSGLFSLAAKRLGAKVFSFDYDIDSVEWTKELKRIYFNEDNNWKIEQGSALDKNYIISLGKFDIVYSWGVLHHTGKMWEALEYANIPVKENGLLFIAIYNDQGQVSQYWLKIKKIYNSGIIGRYFISFIYYTYFTLMNLQFDLRNLNNPLKRYEDYKKSRGMSYYTDIKDWIGGYPFEVAKPEEIFEFYKNKSYILEKLVTVSGGLGCNEFVFRKK